MGFRFYKSVSLGKGIRITASKSGLGIGAGLPGLRYSVHSSGRTRRTMSVPGSGVSHVSYGSARRSSSQGSSRETPTLVVKDLFKTSLFASKQEKEYARGLQDFLGSNWSEALKRFTAVAYADESLISAFFFAGLASNNLRQPDLAIAWLERVVASDQTLPDALMEKYQIHELLKIPFSVTPFVTVEAPVDSVTACLLLAEIQQQEGRNEAAIGYLENLVGLVPNSAPLALSLAELYWQSEMWDELATLPVELKNTDDLSADVLRYKAAGLRQKGLNDAALEVLKETLKSRKRHPEILKAARYERALVYQALNKKAQSRKDFEKIFAEDPTYRDVASRISQ